MRIHWIFINKHNIMRATYGKEMHAELVRKPTQKNNLI
jgi:hypothetical protein